MGNDASTQSFPEFTDYVTEEANSIDCGPRRYYATSDRGSTTLVQVNRDNNDVEVLTTDYLDLGTHYITLTIELEDFPDLTPYIMLTKNFYV
jgi:hypothetical protein